MSTKKERSKAAADLGRRGGLKGGAARAAALTPERRREIAKKAIAARWAPAPERIISDDTRSDYSPARTPRHYTGKPAGPLELVVMALARELYEKDHPGGDWLGLDVSSAAGYCRRAIEARGLVWKLVQAAMRREMARKEEDRR